eukprot:scaffold1410_cov148-Isochrysis_galbana.AAC.4
MRRALSQTKRSAPAPAPTRRAETPQTAVNGLCGLCSAAKMPSAANPLSWTRSAAAAPGSALRTWAEAAVLASPPAPSPTLVLVEMAATIRARLAVSPACNVSSRLSSSDRFRAVACLPALRMAPPGSRSPPSWACKLRRMNCNPERR